MSSQAGSLEQDIQILAGSFASTPAPETLAFSLLWGSSDFRLNCFTSSGIICHIRCIIAHQQVPLGIPAGQVEITRLKHIHRASPEGFSFPGFHWGFNVIL